MKTLSQRKKATIRIFGVEMPEYKDCEKCKSELTCQYLPERYGYMSKCSACILKEDKEYEKINGKRKGHLLIDPKKEVTAVGYDKLTGEKIAITAKGERVSLDKTYYNLKNDPHGWRGTGKKVKGYQR